MARKASLVAVYDAKGYIVKHVPVIKARAIKARAAAGSIRKAVQLYKGFTGRSEHAVQRVKLKPQPKAGLVFGQLLQVGYRSARDGCLYRHTFRSKNSRPLLIASSDGNQLLIVGGRFAFTDRGIEDR